MLVRPVGVRVWSRGASIPIRLARGSPTGKDMVLDRQETVEDSVVRLEREEQELQGEIRRSLMLKVQPCGRFLVRLSELVRAPRGLPGPGFRLPWAAGGQVGWPSRWGHFSGPGGRTAARVPFPRVRSRPLCRGVAKSGPHGTRRPIGRPMADGGLNR